MEVYTLLCTIQKYLVIKSPVKPKFIPIFGCWEVFQNLTMALVLTQFSWCASSVGGSAWMSVLPHILTHLYILANFWPILINFVSRKWFSWWLNPIINFWSQLAVAYVNNFDTIILQNNCHLGTLAKITFSKPNFNDLMTSLPRG